MKKSYIIGRDWEFLTAARVFKFSTVIDISLWTRFLHSLIEYFSKINTTTPGAHLSGFIFCALFFLQTLIPSLLINSVDLWPRDSIITSIFRIVCSFCDGPSVDSQDQRIYVSFSILFLFLLSFILLCFRSHYFSKLQILTSTESSLMLFYFKYILVFFLPLLLSGYPLSIYKITQKDYSFFPIFNVIFVPIVYILYVIAMIVLIFPRVLLENVPNHCWLPKLSVLPFISTEISSLLSTCVGFTEGKTRVIFPFLIFLLKFATGFITIKFSIYTKTSFSILASSIEFTSSVIALLQFINIFVQKISPDIIIIMIFLFLVIFFILLKFINSKRIRSVLTFYDNLSYIESPDHHQQSLNERYQTSSQFISDILLTIENWHPIISSWKLFDYADTRWPKSFTIFFLHSRAISLFPSMNSTLMFIHSKMSHSSISILQSIYMKQFDCLMQSRQVTVSPKIEKKIDEAQNRLSLLLSLLRRFWVNILQKSTLSFWDDVDKINKILSDVDAILLQLTRDYPNNEDVWIEYYRFVVNIKHDIKESNKIKNKIHNLLSRRKQQADLAMTLAIQIYPNIQTSVQDCGEINRLENQLEEEYPYHENDENNDNNNNNDDNDNDDGFDFFVSDYSKGFKINKNSIYDDQVFSNNNNNDSKVIKKKNKDAYQQMQIATQDLIEHSKLGNALTGIIICTVLTILSIIFFYLFSHRYTSAFIQKQKNSLFFLEDLSLLYYHLSYFNLYIITYPLFQSKTIKIDNSLMDIVAPNLYTTSKLLPIWSFDAPLIQDYINDIRKLYSGLIESLYNLDKSDINVKSMVKLIELEPVYNDYTLGSTVDRLLSSIESMFNSSTMSYLEKLEQYDIYPTLNSTYQTLENILNFSLKYLNNFHGNILIEINGLMALAMISNLLLVSISLVIINYLFHIQNDAITNSFLYFPNSENRRVITKFGHHLTVDPDLSHLSALATKNNDSYSNKIFFVLVFAFSFVPFSIGCLLIYFFAHNFKSVANETTLSISTLYLPFTYLTLSMEAINREYIYILYSENISDYLYDQAELYLENANNFFSKGMWNNVCNIDLYFTSDDRAMNSLFNDYFKDMRIIRTKSLFELLILNEFHFSIDLLIGSLKQFISLNLTTDSLFQEQHYLSLLFYFTSVSDEKVNKPYFNLVENDVETILDSRKSDALIVTIVIFVIQIIACILINLSLLKKSIQIKKSLRFYQDLSPEILSQNNNAMTLIDTGKSATDRVATSFKNSDLILMNIPHGVFIASRDLLIVDYNTAFRDLVKPEAHKKLHKMTGEVTSEKSENDVDDDDDDDGILNQPLTAIVRPVPGIGDDNSWPIFVQHLTEVFTGARKPQFSEEVSIKFSKERVVNLKVNTIGLIHNFPASEGENELIDDVAVVIEDVTDEVSKLQNLREEKEEIDRMIAKVLPKSFINDLIKSDEESISFVVQNASIGFISIIDNQSQQVKSQQSQISLYLPYSGSTFMKFPEFNIPSSSEKLEIDDLLQKKLNFFNTLYEKFDKLMEAKEFNLICKVRTSANVYMFAGGIFSRAPSKSETVEVQTCKFALKAIDEALNFVQTSMMSGVEVRVGIHSGGPVVAGAVSVNRPSFQILGPVGECAMKLLSACEPWKIAVSRSVYENIFTSGFRIFEKGEIKMRNGNDIQVYQISLDN